MMRTVSETQSQPSNETCKGIGYSAPRFVDLILHMIRTPLLL